MEKNISLAKNRAEEFGYDLFENFIIPPYFGELALLQSKKPRIIIGGRGCGKTMLLRYLCHESQFSSKRKNIGKETLKNIGIYWKIDTQFVKILSRCKDEDVGSRAFTHMTVLIISREILKSLDSLKKSSIGKSVDISKLDFSEIWNFDTASPHDFLFMKSYLKKNFHKFELWASNINKIEEPIFFPLNYIIELINLIKEQITQLGDSDFCVYIDEYENLLQGQKRIVNTWVKHSEMPLIFNLAVKRNALDERRTIGNEQIVQTDDYRLIDIEKSLDTRYELFAAEILLLRLKNFGYDLNYPINTDELFDPSDSVMEKRKSEQYKKDVTNVVRKIFPKYTEKEIVNKYVHEKTIKTLINDSLKRRGAIHSCDDFFVKNRLDAMAVLPFLLNRNTLSEDCLLKQVGLLNQGQDNKFDGKTGWIHNNLFNCILYIFNSKLEQICPLYSGFDSFCTMSKGNIRHFLELCFKSLADYDTSSKELSIEPEKQAAATMLVSQSLLNEIKFFGTKGNSLYKFVYRLGSIFEHCRNNITQSEPEQNHFSILGDLFEDEQSFIKELNKWSVIYEEKLTKSKNGEAGIEYILNPIYSSYFNISFRKKRRINFHEKDFRIICFDSDENFNKLLNKYPQKANIETQEELSLFD